MTDRRIRRWFGSLAALMMMSVAVLAEGPSPGESLAKLKAGNAAFVANPAEPLPVDAARRSAVAKGRMPFAAILSCADAAVPPEIVFHAGLGDLFVVRAAGPIADRSILASLEYAVESLHVPLLLVMGHESCGIIRTGLESDDHTPIGPNFEALLKQLRPVVTRSTASGEAARLRGAVLENVEEQINELLQDSTTLRAEAEAGHIAVVGAYYELTSGTVHFSEPIRVMAATETTRRH